MFWRALQPNLLSQYLAESESEMMSRTRSRRGNLEKMLVPFPTKASTSWLTEWDTTFLDRLQETRMQLSPATGCRNRSFGDSGYHQDSGYHPDSGCQIELTAINMINAARSKTIFEPSVCGKTVWFLERYTEC